jgi:hypothetical protein
MVCTRAGLAGQAVDLVSRTLADMLASLIVKPKGSCQGPMLRRADLIRGTCAPRDLAAIQNCRSGL